jgi:ATP-dependent RNA helicase DeaD
MKDSFAALGLSDHWSERLRERGITEPVSIQEQAIPELLTGADGVIRSGTGTGKTLAYLLPLAQQLDPAQSKEQAIILAPTAELAMQIVKLAGELFAGTNLTVLGLIGGASVKRQLEKLKVHPQLIVGTPGRLVELLKINKLKTSAIRMIVIDEADQTFALGAGGEAEYILKRLPADRQIVFCSATMPEEATQTAKRWMKDPRWIVAGEADTDRPAIPSTIEHTFIVAEERDKVDTVRRLIRTLSPKSAIVFVNDTDRVAEVESKLQYMGLKVAAIYGDQPKQERSSAMRRFRDGTLPYLIATDVAARGLDAPDVTLIVHFDPPTDELAYLHRAGRTGRMGKSGVSAMIVTPKQRFIATKLSKELGIAMAEKRLSQGEFAEAARARTVQTRTGRAQPERQLTPKPRQPKEQARVSARKEDRHRDRKDKGAPRWLKEKRNAAKQGESNGVRPPNP